MTMPDLRKALVTIVSQVCKGLEPVRSWVEVSDLGLERFLEGNSAPECVQ
jgi:hypothetical protein